MTSPLISIIIPCYNLAPWIGLCLESVLAQSYGNWECLVIDDESTDGSADRLDEFAAKDTRIKVIHQKNQGEGGARNTGLRIAKGTWILFLDGDDVLALQALERLVQLIDSCPDEKLIRFGYEQFQDGGEWVPSDCRRVVVRKDVSTRIPMVDFFTYVWQHLYRREILEGIQFKKYRRGCDRVFVDEVLLNRVQSFVETSEVFYGYRLRLGSAVNSIPTVQTLLDEMDHRCDIIEMCDASTKVVRYERDGGDFWLEQYLTNHFLDILAKCVVDERKLLLDAWRDRLLRFQKAKRMSVSGRLLVRLYRRCGDSFRLLQFVATLGRFWYRFNPYSLILRVSRRINRFICSFGILVSAH